MKLINADAIIAALESFSDRAHGNQHYLNVIETAKELIAEADEAVVRCWDCKYWEPATLSSGNCGKAFGPPAYKDDYCSYGERGTNEPD